MPSEYKEMKIQYKYRELPEEPRYKKKKKKVHKKSDHKHDYQPCLFKVPVWSYIKGKKERCIYAGTYCTICGRIGDITVQKMEENNSLPIFSISFFDKFVNQNIGD